MREQIYIDGVLMQQTGDKAASLVFQSPFFTEIDGIAGNRSNAIEFPATDANRAALGLSHLDRSGSRYAARKHTAQYYLDGVQVFNGEAVLQSITPQALKFSFTWGNVSAFSRLLGYRLRDLQTIDAQDYIPYTEQGIIGTGRYGRNMGYQRMPVPTMGAAEVLARLAGVTLVDIDVTPFTRYRIPLLTRLADAKSKEAQALNITHGQIRRKNTTDAQGRSATIYVLEPTAQDSDLAGLHTEGGVLDVSEVETLRLTVTRGTQYAIHCTASDWNSGFVRSKQQVSLYACDEDGQNIRQIAVFGGRTVDSVQSAGAYYHRVTYGAQERLDVNVSEYSYLLIGVGGVGATGSFDDNAGLTAGRVWAVADPEAEDTAVAVGGILPLYANLPDWTGSQLLKNLMKLEGLFPVCPDDKTIRFVSVDSLYGRRAEAYDWTGRIDLENAQPQERTTALGGYFQKNLFKYAKDAAVTGEYDGEMRIADETLEKEGELVSVDFAATDGGMKPVLVAWRMNDEQEWEYVADGYTPRVLVDDGSGNYSFAGMDWNTLIADKYGAFARVVSNPRIVKARVLLDAAELGTLDLTRPVYSYGAGCYWAISKVTTAGDGTATAELLRMGEAGEDASSLRLPTYANPTQGLVVLRDEQNRWVTRCAGHTDEQNAEMSAEDSGYRIVMERWGYARRGKFRRYVNKYGVEQTTHTVRKGATTEYEQVYACYRASGEFIGYGVLGQVPDEGWAMSLYPKRKYVYHAVGAYWQEAGEGHIFRDSETKGDSLPESGYWKAGEQYACYLNVRASGGFPKKWRAIGRDILLHGREPQESQTFNSGRYDGATLVCRLGDVLTLPTLKRVWVIGKNGRYHNRARNGLTELAVSLWHHEPQNGGWVRVSNRVRVRSRNKDCSELWEFDEANTVTVSD